MEKKVIVKFNTGEKIELDAESVANAIAERRAADSHSDAVAELLKDEFTLFQHIWSLPWIELNPHIKCGDTQPRKICYCNEWRKGNATVSVNW